MSNNDNIEDGINDPDLSVYFLDSIVKQLSVIYFQLENNNKHYHKEFVYNLRSITRELKQEMEGGHFSLEYILEKSQKLLYCAREIKNGQR